MTANTSNRGYPYPQGTDFLGDTAAAVQALASAVDADVAGVAGDVDAVASDLAGTDATVANLLRAVEASKSAPLQSFPNGSVDTLATFDTWLGSGIDHPAASRLSAPVAGTYRWALYVATSANLNGYYRANVRKNAAGAGGGGVELGQAQFESSSAIPAGYGIQMQATGLVALASGDYLEAFVRHNFAAAVDLSARMGLQWVRP